MRVNRLVGQTDIAKRLRRQLALSAITRFDCWSMSDTAIFANNPFEIIGNMTRDKQTCAQKCAQIGGRYVF